MIFVPRSRVFLLLQPGVPMFGLVLNFHASNRFHVDNNVNAGMISIARKTTKTVLQFLL